MGELGRELRTEADVLTAAQEAGIPAHALAVGQTLLLFDRPLAAAADSGTDPAAYLGVDYLPD